MATLAPLAWAQSYDTQERTVTIERVTDGLSSPWSIAFLSNDDWLVTERTGQLRRIINGVLQPQAISGTPEVDAKGQGGLLDVVPDLNYADNGWI